METREALDRVIKINNAVLKSPSPVDLIKACGGYYECPKDYFDKRIGPLVGYAGRYDDPKTAQRGLQYVGDIYVNFAALERYSMALNHVARQIYARVRSAQIAPVDGFCGAPEGGKALATMLAYLGSGQYIFPEKKITAVATAHSREQSKLVFSRHEPMKDERWVVVEDVCNNFSTTAELVMLIESYGATVVGIVCFLNRSVEIDVTFQKIPVVSLVRKPLPQFKQDDPAVAEDVARGNVVWKPKNEWPRLEVAMGN